MPRCKIGFLLPLEEASDAVDRRRGDGAVDSGAGEDAGTDVRIWTGLT